MNGWIIFGFCGQALFFMRFFVQWVVSEKRRESVIPVYFWYFSVGGGTVLLIYAVHLRDPVFIAGQAAGLLVYLRNLMFIYRKKKRESES